MLGNGYTSVLDNVHDYVPCDYDFRSERDVNGNMRPIIHILYNAGTCKYEVFPCLENLPDIDKVAQQPPKVTCPHCDAVRRHAPPAFIAKPVTSKAEDILLVLPLASRVVGGGSKHQRAVNASQMMSLLFGGEGSKQISSQLPANMMELQKRIVSLYETHFAPGRDRIKVERFESTVKPSALSTIEEEKKIPIPESIITDEKKGEGREEEKPKRMYDPKSFPKFPEEILSSLSHIPLFRSLMRRREDAVSVVGVSAVQKSFLDSPDIPKFLFIYLF
jgi:hypothetical protein